MATPNGNQTGPFTPSPPIQSVVLTSTAQPPTSSAVVVDTTATSIASVSQPPTVVSASAPPVIENTIAQTTESPPTTRIITSVLSAQPDGNKNGGSTNAGPQTILVTSTQPASSFPTRSVTQTISSKSSSSSSNAAALQTSASGGDSTSSGFSPGGKIAVAVVVPVVAVALIVLAALFLWRKRKQKKDAEEMRRKEVEEYGFNPNNDPTLPAVGGASSNGDEPSEMRETDGAGYRGWGTTSTNRKPSTTLSSGNGPIGVARSTSNSDNGRYTNNSPTAGTNKSSDVQSGDPLMGNPSNGRPLTADSETIGALGAVPTKENRQDIHRGPSNASSAYSGAHRSDTSGEGAIPGSAPGQQYYNDGLFYDEGMPQHGPYGDGSYGGGQPVIRDVQARRNTRIENPSVIPQQGNAGIAQNF